MSGTLTFGGSPFHVMLPWTAVYAAMVEGEQRGTVWPEDVPEDVLTGSSPAETQPASPPSALPVATAMEIETAEPAPRAKRNTHLKLVE